MITEIILPQLGDTMNEGTILRWYKKEGERVEKGEPLFEVLTDKANMQVEAMATGYLRNVKHRENETVPTGEVIAFITTTPDESLQPPSPTQGEIETGGAPHAGEAIGDRVTERAFEPGEKTAEIESPRSAWGTRSKQFISPRAKRLAKESGIDLSQVRASNPSGRVVEADVQKFLQQRERVKPVQPIVAQPSSQPSPSSLEGEEIIPITGVRKVIFERMAASSREVARVTLTTEADATRLVELRADINERATDTKFSYTEFIVMLVAKALQKFPYMNATLREDGIHQHRAVHIGIAVETQRGLLVPVIRDAQRKGLGEISRALRELSEKTRSGKISPDDLRGSTFTITNLGEYEIDAFTPIVNQPETAILGIGRIAQKPAAYHGQLALRHMVALSLSFDHRVVDGAPAARFLQEIKRLVETPGLLLV